MKLTDEYQKKWVNIFNKEEAIAGMDGAYIICSDRAWNRFIAEVIIPEAFEAGRNLMEDFYNKAGKFEEWGPDLEEFSSKIIEK